MKTLEKVLIMISVAAILVGVFIFTFVLGSNGFKFSNFNSSSLETNTYEINDKFFNILINDDETDT